ncbi:MAG: RNA-binding transcriptional accessory protein [Bacteroidetes bacterium]|nr:RNA-binding transcriptional accessory protein [Bacteroidota bacterium]
MTKIEFLLQQTRLNEKGVQNTLALLDEGATIPFISRYRKERTGGLDEVEIGLIRDTSKLYQDIIARQKFILETVAEQGKLNDLLREKIETCFDTQKLEDIYLPYKKKKVTKGEKARKAGLEPLAKLIMSQRGGDPYQMAERYIKGEIYDEEEALQGARDIMAEWMNENGALRDRLRDFYRRKALVIGKVVKGKETEGQVYKDYFDFSEPLYRIASHRFLAVSRAEKEGVIKLKIDVPSEDVWAIMERFFVKSKDDCGQQVLKACKESYSRMLSSSIETEVYNEAKEKADKDALKIFNENLRQLLLASPVGSKRTLAIDPGFRTGCKVVVLDEKGDLLNNTTIFPHPPQNEKSAAQSKIAQLAEAYKVEVVAIGDGTAGRETEAFIKTIRFKNDLEVYIVREDGASIYSASPIARKEFPQFDVTVRGAVSIGRRLMDPLAELVKIEPKSLGVGSYQHEVNATLLKTSLDDVVVSCVNSVGVDINTASPYLLQYISGLGPALAENIVKFRSEKGFFKSREDLRAVPRMGDKAFEQSAGFLRVREGSHPLDNSAVHPERYDLVNKMASQLKLEVKELIANDSALKQLKKEDFPQVDSFTFEDIISELKKPGRDPRQTAKVFEFDHRLKTIGDVVVGMQVPGIITNVTAFGAFVNLGIKENGLIHKSQMGDNYVEDPSTVVRLHQHVNVLVTELDVTRKRVGLRLLK